ncbi:MAG: flagellar motor switch protein FliN [Cellvibrionaceae bacterium]|nr:flagellar motor switch protein FliN [Cellvibrionaceae bacterium]MCV6627204.1 flagellar motor switch protein FliN [Cellvibrionaceae bacterium]
MAEAGEGGGESGAEDDWAAAMAEAGVEPETEPEPEPAPVAADTMPLQEFSQGGDGSQPDLQVVLDIPVTMSMEVGQTSISIRNLLQLTQGSVIELDRLAGEPLDVLVNGTLIAHGEVVVVNEKFGIRMTDVISPQERIQRLR